MRVGSLFSGIGGFDLGLERAGMKITWQVEIDEFCNKVLAKHWPHVKRYGDIRSVGKANLEPVDLICGGFPCQPFSCAGKRKGAEDDRALWPEMFRVIQEIRPRWIVGENVAGIISMELDNCISDLEREGYSVQTFIIPACAVGAPHRRDRVWIVAQYSKDDAESGERLSGHTNESVISGGETRKECCRSGSESLPNSTHERLQGSLEAIRKEGQEPNDELLHGCGGEWTEPWFEVATRLCRVDDGLPRQMDRVKRLKALGNAVVPQIVEIIGRAIMEIESAT